MAPRTIPPRGENGFKESQHYATGSLPRYPVGLEIAYIGRVHGQQVIMPAFGIHESKVRHSSVQLARGERGREREMWKSAGSMLDSGFKQV